MVKIYAMCLSVLFLALVSVRAQDSNGEICIQSDTGNALLVFNSKTGDYKFVRCQDAAAFSGTGQVSISGCQIVLHDERPTHSISASVDSCVQQGKGEVKVPKGFSQDGTSFVPAMNEAFGDTNLRDNTCSCTPSEPVTGGDRDLIGPPIKGGSVTQPAPIKGSDPELIGPPVSDGGSKEVIVQSDGGEAFIVFNSTTGDYKFIRCDGIALSGTGQLKNDGCFTMLEDNRDNFRVFVAVNVCLHAAKITVDVPKAFPAQDGSIVPVIHDSYGDSDLTDSTASCSGS